MPIAMGEALELIVPLAPWLLAMGGLLIASGALSCSEAALF